MTHKDEVLAEGIMALAVAVRGGAKRNKWAALPNVHKQGSQTRKRETLGRNEPEDQDRYKKIIEVTLVKRKNCKVFTAA
jgi:hypothetical protein